MPTTSVVTPWARVLSQSRLASKLQSEWEWQSMNPGATILPVASIAVTAATAERSPMAAIFPPAIPTSARTQGAPLRPPPARRG